MSRRRTELDARCRVVRRRLVQALALSPALLLAPPAVGQSLRLAVVYPEVSAAYAQVFGNIITGLQSVAGVTLLSREVRPDTGTGQLEQWLDQEQADGVVALGQNVHQLVRQMKSSRPTVAGAALLAPGGTPGISLAADPEQLFAHLESLAPPVKRVFLVYHADTSAWLVPLAREAARRRGIELVAREARDSRETAQAYRRILEEEVRDGEDGLWLPLDSAAPDASVLAMVLETAWRKRLVVFSNNTVHAKKGALFALFPDDIAMGRRLGELFLDLKRRNQPGGVEPLRELKVAVNVRTASHLGRVYTSGEQRGFALVFPSE